MHAVFTDTRMHIKTHNHISRVIYYITAYSYLIIVLTVFFIASTKAFP